jgi:poly-gamma-glutamate synthesis protein (capsule biosynthesis protein)
MGMEVYKEKLIIYGAGDFINDYEGISGKQEYRGELSLMYFPEVAIESGKLLSLKMIPMKIKKLRLNPASRNDVEWLQKTLDREGKELGTGLRIEKDNSLWLEW